MESPMYQNNKLSCDQVKSFFSSSILQLDHTIGNKLIVALWRYIILDNLISIGSGNSLSPAMLGVKPLPEVPTYWQSDLIGESPVSAAPTKSSFSA